MYFAIVLEMLLPRWGSSSLVHSSKTDGLVGNAFRLEAGDCSDTPLGARDAMCNYKAILKTRFPSSL